MFRVEENLVPVRQRRPTPATAGRSGQAVSRAVRHAVTRAASSAGESSTPSRRRYSRRQVLVSSPLTVGGVPRVLSASSERAVAARAVVDGFDPFDYAD
jgi:hypothetical protein